MMERHDYTDDVPQLPAELLANAQGQHGNGQQPHGMPQVPEENILPLDANPIQLLFQSLLPWMQVDPHLQMNENQNGVDMPGLANMLEQLQVAFALDQDNNVDPDDVKTEDLD
jgi:hypothetical protein